jgi:putative hydrolases of HD superfamily
LESIRKILAFVVEVEKLKAVLRKTRPVGLERYENSAEHSWHVCLTALMLKDYANEPVDIDRVIRMLLIHDLGEIDAGDTIVYASDNPQYKAQEAAGLERVMSLLSEYVAREYVALFNEFEAGETPESKYAKAIDRVPPLIQNLMGDGHSWRENQVPKEKVFQVNERIARGSEQLWQVLRRELDLMVAKGVLK